MDWNLETMSLLMLPHMYKAETCTVCDYAITMAVDMRKSFPAFSCPYTVSQGLELLGTTKLECFHTVVYQFALL